GDRPAGEAPCSCGCSSPLDRVWCKAGLFIFNFLLEEMGKRIDDLEKHVADLMTEAGIENTNEELRVK
uniref:HSBPL protein n=1 Tax=Otus sunia TaxID=257818 RepID=A0A8C8B6Y2_9STRI